MPNTSEQAGFKTKWNDLYHRAKAAGYPDAAIAPVYDLDQQRLRTGGNTYQLSRAEAWSMLQAAGQGHPITQAPAQAQPFSVGRLPSYAGTDLKQFGAGLISLFKKGLTDVIHPTHAAHQLEALWRDPNVIENPLRALEFTVTHPTAPGSPLTDAVGKSPLLMALLPGAADVVDAHQHGMSSLAEHPFTSLLDVAPGIAAAGHVARAFSRLGMSDEAINASAEAGRFRPTDTSNEAVAARARAKELVTSELRRAAASNPSGVFGLLNRVVLEHPFRGDTMGGYLAHKLNATSRGTLGPLTASIGRIVQQARRAESHGAGAIVKETKTWYADHGLTTPKELRDFQMLTTHFRPDWRQTMALEPGEADKLENALRDYDVHVQLEKSKDLAADRLQLVQDPRTGEYEVRGTAGADAQVATKNQLYLRSRQAVAEVGTHLANLTGDDVPADGEAARAKVLDYVRRAVLEPADRFVAMDPKNEALVRGAFPGQRLGTEDVDPTNPEAVRALFERARTQRIRRSDVLRVSRLLGPGGSFAHLRSYITAGKTAEARALLAKMIPTARSAYAQSNPALAALVPDLIRARDVLTFWNKASTQSAFRLMETRRAALEKAIDRQPEARFAPRMAELVQDRLMAHLDGQDVSEEDMALVAYQVANGVWKGETFAQIVTPREMTKIVNSALSELRREKEAGLDPKFVYATTSREIPRLGAPQAEERIVQSRSSKSRARFNPSAVYDPIIGLTRKQLEDLSEQVAHEMFYGEHGILPRFQVKFDDAIKQAMQLVKTPEDPAMLRHHLDQWVRDNYAELDPRAYFPRKAAEATGVSAATPVLVPKDVKTALDANYDAIKGPQNLAARAYVSGTQLFRFTLLDFSPRYQVHIWGGGSVLLMMRSSPLEMARYLPAALGMMVQDSEGMLRDWARDGHVLSPVLNWLKTSAKRQGEEGMRPQISHGVAEADPSELTNAWNFAKGKKMGAWMATLMEKRGLNAGMQMANFGADMLRSLAFLIGKNRAAGDVDAGIRFALKVFADMDSMTPLERSIIRYVMPFYGWTKHILRYALTYPVDHPYRAAVLSQVINQEWADWNTGIPQSMVYLFELGGVGADGAATVLDVRQLDPLRSVSDIFTMTGFMSSLNPAIQNVVLPALGIDPTTAGPEDLYPTMTIDQFYGTEQAAPRNPLGIAEHGIAGYIPEANAIETVLGMSSYARWAKANDPTAYRNAIYQAFNFPWVPYKVNLYQVVAKEQERLFNVARDQATTALADPNPNSPAWKALMGYSYVPYNGWYVQPAALRQWAFDQVIKAGMWNGQTATMAPSSIIVPPSPPRI